MIFISTCQFDDQHFRKPITAMNTDDVVSKEDHSESEWEYEYDLTETEVC